MDIGMIVIHLTNGRPIVARCEVVGQEMQLVPATNEANLVVEAQQVLVDQGVLLDEEGIYLCSDELQAAAQFPPLALPHDAIPYSAAHPILYPDLSQEAARARIWQDAKAGHLGMYRLGIGQELRQYVSRGEALRLAAARAGGII